MAFDMCGCAGTPVNYWRLPSGTWVIGADPARAGIGPGAPEAAAREDGDQYLALGCIAFVIACPECGRVYESGGDWQNGW